MARLTSHGFEDTALPYDHQSEVNIWLSKYKTSAMDGVFDTCKSLPLDITNKIWRWQYVTLYERETILTEEQKDWGIRGFADSWSCIDASKWQYQIYKCGTSTTYSGFLKQSEQEGVEENG